jgi:UPF0716 family protein affecting phage T7 exclusion
MQCNIDRRGQRTRLVLGLVLLLAAVGLALTWLLGFASGWWVTVVLVALFGSGGFAIFEARKRWCALRAMRVNTPV